ncbi:hypothetical protein NPIL_606261 [Nephila pilipes]|uniref:Uncharacterized protein n=1 Tax=Nephila pilipes TaxID=299642 RepID=A0A8X6UL03_NEPPI|nr:hypothetical protein NPIL_199111 [Nephila pilipes]GFU20806.1 hypothetical protein NPIL_606261 [Nephila pilipes]
MYDLYASQEMFEITPIDMNALITPTRHELTSLFEDIWHFADQITTVCQVHSEFMGVSYTALFMACPIQMISYASCVMRWHLIMLKPHSASNMCEGIVNHLRKNFLMKKVILKSISSCGKIYGPTKLSTKISVYTLTMNRCWAARGWISWKRVVRILNTPSHNKVTLLLNIIELEYCR